MRYHRRKRRDARIGLSKVRIGYIVPREREGYA
jgi:hypothetical protein